jgi:chaperonin cofactor prefoldin
MNEDAEEAARDVAYSSQEVDAQQALQQQIENILKDKPEVAEQVGATQRISQTIEELRGDATIADIGGLGLKLIRESNMLGPKVRQLPYP